MIHSEGCQSNRVRIKYRRRRQPVRYCGNCGRKQPRAGVMIIFDEASEISEKAWEGLK